MQNRVDAYLAQLNKSNTVRRFITQTLTTLSLIVVVGVFWCLKLTGITMAGEAFCGMEEHVHTEACGLAEPVQICELEEVEGHLHTEACFEKVLICGITSEMNAESEQVDAEPEQVDAEPEQVDAEPEQVDAEPEQVDAEPEQVDAELEQLGTELEDVIASHEHVEECYELKAICGSEEFEGHTHGEGCYEVNTGCELEEHTHIESCYSNIEADVETSDDWEMTLADLVRREKHADNLISVAGSQLGYKESELNFQVGEDGVRRGYTRYGEWYGNPYGDWATMFTSFCLEYAGIMEIPVSAGAESMLLGTEEAGLYRAAAEYTPVPGDILFLDKNLNEAADTTAIITAVEENTIFVIEGDFDNTVAETAYLIDDAAIVGYGTMPDADLASQPEILAPTYTVWLDGTNGGTAKAHAGSSNTKYTVSEGEKLLLPTEWKSPTKYDYKIQGWYDVVNSKYYPAGAEVEVRENLVFYADWVPRTYDIGEFDEYTCNTVDTSEFITTHLFDYNYLFNVMSTKASVTVSANNHSESWSMVGNGNVPYKNMETLDFIFQTYDTSGRIIQPSNMTNNNTYKSTGLRVTEGIFNERLKDVLFGLDNSFNPATGEGIIGKTYVGSGDYLMQYADDPSSPYYGYYYYDAQLHAASYNQSAGRFYVYDYLEATSDTRSNGGSLIADFLPLNSPYANSNGNPVGTYTHNGNHGEYNGTTHYYYDSDYSSSGNRVATNFSFGMSTSVEFHLPNKPGEKDKNGEYGNRDLYGREMHFEFYGDDDVWVMVDDQLVLDLGGIHQSQRGEINFSQGYVKVDGTDKTNDAMRNLDEGEHVLTVYYLDRGGSMSNCAFFYNVAPYLSLNIQKEDVLTQELLDGTQFSVYKDLLCTEPAELWVSEESHNNHDEPTNVFTVTNGTTDMWGFSSGNTYYIKETKPPDAENYGKANGIIKITFDKDALASYNVEIVNEVDANGNFVAEVSKGYTVHGIKIDESSQKVYLKVTNAPESVKETTTVQVLKKWEDNADHSNDYITAYLTVKDPDGTVRRIREIVLSDENGWTYTWTNLPKYDYDTLAEVTYGVEESYESGYYSTVRKVTEINIETVAWAEATSFISNDSYILKNTSGYLSTTSSSDTRLKWVDEETAKNSPLALWTGTVSGGNVKLTNGVGQILTFNNGSSSSNRYFHAITGSSSYQSFTPVNTSSGFRFYATRGNTKYYMQSLTSSNGRISSTTTASKGLVLTPMKKIAKTDIQQVKDWAYQITNTPLAANNETSVTVTKNWVLPEEYSANLYKEYQITIALYANGVSAGRTVTLNLRNGWKGVFQGLPYKDNYDKVIQYTVEEVWSHKDWELSSIESVTTNGTPPTYSAIITNTYRPSGPMLPSTGTRAHMMYVMCGSGMMLTALILGIRLRRKKGGKI